MGKDLREGIDNVRHHQCKDRDIGQVPLAPSKLIFNVFSASGKVLNEFVGLDGEVSCKSLLLML